MWGFIFQEADPSIIINPGWQQLHPQGIRESRAGRLAPVPPGCTPPAGKGGRFLIGLSSPGLGPAPGEEAGGSRESERPGGPPRAPGESVSGAQQEGTCVNGSERLPRAWAPLRLGRQPEPPSEGPPRLVSSAPVDTAAPWAVLPARAWTQGSVSRHAAELPHPPPTLPLAPSAPASWVAIM